MAIGYMQFNKSIFDRWSPQRIAEFDAFLQKALSVETTIEDEASIDAVYIYKLDHPHFLCTDGEPTYVFKWGKVLSDDGYNYFERIVGLYILRDNHSVELVHTYHTEKRTIHGSFPSFR